MKNSALVFLSIFLTTFLFAQQSDLPYKAIPPYPAKYTANTVAARAIDGLGYRYYWATEELRKEDLEHRISEDSRTADEILDHLYLLSLTIVNGPKSEANLRSLDISGMTFDQKRAGTLKNLKQASDLLKAGKRKDMKKYKVIFQRGERKNEFPFWNLINGPIADAIYHTGQIVSYRRASGNPLNPKVNVFIGKTRE